MKAVQVHQFGAPSVLTVEEISAPTPNAGQVLIRVHAAGVSPLDTYTLGDVGGFASDASNSYSLKQLQVGQQTFAGPTGSGTSSVTNLTDIFSNAGQAIAVK